MRCMEDAGTGERVVSAVSGVQADRDSDALARWCPDGVGSVGRQEPGGEPAEAVMRRTITIRHAPPAS